MIIVAGGGWVARSEAGVYAEVARAEWPRLLASAPAGADLAKRLATRLEYPRARPVATPQRHPRPA